MIRNRSKVFVQRDAAGQVIQVSLHPQEGFEPCFAVSEEDAPGFREQIADQLNDLASSDLSLVRVLEDLIDLMIDKNLICFTDLPEAAKQKLLDRRSIRSEITGLDLLGDEDDEIF